MGVPRTLNTRKIVRIQTWQLSCIIIVLACVKNAYQLEGAPHTL
jgi:hypothetical protein